MTFTEEYSKLKKATFTTIRKNTGFYKKGRIYTIKTPQQKFLAFLSKIDPLKKEEITENLAKQDADCSKKELIKKLEKWYGKEFNNFVIITLTKNQ